MTTSDRFFRLRIFDAAGTTPVLALSSHSGTNPYIAEPPRGDGEEIDVVTGEVRHGSYTVLAVDPESGAGADIITAQIADAGGQYQLLGRKADISISSDGSAWTIQTAGYVESVRFVDAVSAEITIGDAQRIDLHRQVFQSAAQRDGGTWVPSTMDGVTCLIGGPVRGTNLPNDPNTDRAIWGLYSGDRGGWRMKVTAAGSGQVSLVFVRGFVSAVDTASWTAYQPVTSLPARIRDEVNARSEEYLQPRNDHDWFYPELVARLTPWGGGTTTYPTPISKAIGTDTAPLLLRQATLALEWAGTLPSVNDEFEVWVYPAPISETNPLHIFSHPIDLVTQLWDEAGIAYDTTAAASAKAALGPGTRVLYRITAPETLRDAVQRLVFGPFGVGYRPGDDGERELFIGRKRNASAPGTTVSLSDLLGSGDDQPALFDLDESSIINVVAVVQRGFSIWTALHHEERTVDGVLEYDDAVRVEIEGGDGTHEATYELPGRVVTANSAMGFIFIVDFANAFAQALATDILLRFGTGCPSVDLEVREEAAVDLGEEFILDVDHQINGNTRGGVRILQVIRRTPQPDGGVSLHCLDAGANSQVATAPTISLAAVGKGAVTITITNAATLASDGSTVRLEWGVAGSQPTDGELLALVDPGDVTAFTTPRVDSGSRVWVRARAEHPNRRPSAFSAWSDVDLTDLSAPTGIGNSGNVVSWTVGESAYPLAVDVTVSSRTERIRILDAGSTSIDLTGMVPAATSIDVDVYHVDEPPLAGQSAAASHTYTTPAAPALTAPVGAAGFVERLGFRYTGMGGMECTQIADFPCSIEFEMAIETGVGAGTFGSFISLGMVEAVVGGPTRISVFSPNDGLERRFRARAVREGATPSSYTSSVDILPWGSFGVPPTLRRNLPIMLDTGTADGFPAKASALDGDLDANIDGDTEVQGGSLYLEDDQSLPVGTIATPSTVGKTMRIPAGVFIPANDQMLYQMVGNTLRPRALNTSVQLRCSVVMPNGVTITGWSARVSEQTGGLVALTLKRITDESTSANIGSLAGTSAAAWETVSEVLNEDTEGNMYSITAELSVTSPPGTLTSDAELLEVTIDYDVPDHTKTL